MQTEHEDIWDTLIELREMISTLNKRLIELEKKEALK